jgi:hypothetical protein
MVAPTSSVDPDAYVESLQAPIRERIRLAVKRETSLLRQASSDVESADIDRLTDLLQRAVDWGATADDDGFVDFVASTVDVVVRQGVGEEFRRPDELIEAMDGAAAALARRGRPTTDLHLARATYLATLSNGGPARRAAIESAITSAQSPEELLRARLTLARFCIDVSDYEKARQIADECEQMALSTPHGGAARIEILATRTLATYYVDHQRATPGFQQIIDLARAFPNSAEIQRIAGEAHHFLGRTHALNREYEPALLEMVEGQRLAWRSGVQQRKSLAFFHIRMADVLLDAGSLDDARYHVEEASWLLRVVQESSAAEAQVDVLAARLHLHRGDWRWAEEVLRSAIAVMRRDHHFRGALVGMAQLVRVYAAGHHYGRAIVTAARLVALWWTTESTSPAGRPRASRWQSARVAAQTARRAVTWRQRTSKPGLRCPCGASHERPIRQSRAAPDGLTASGIG